MRKLLAVIVLLGAAVCAFGQGSTVPFPPAVNSQGNFLSFAKITFCTTPATLDTLGNCTNTVTVYKDQALTQPYSSAILTDGIGYFPPNANTATSLWFSPAANLCYTLTTSSMTSPATNPCTPFSVSITPGSSPTFAGGTFTGNVSVGGTLGAKSVNSVIDLVGSGCKGDGATDDKACIATVLAAAGALSTQNVTICITDNHIFNIGTNPGGNQVFTLPSNVSLGCKGAIRIGNSFGNYRVLFNATAGASFATYQDFTVDGNATNNAVNVSPIGTNERIAIQLTGGTSQSVTAQNIHFINGNDVQTLAFNTCNDCHFRGNTWSNYGIGGTFDHDSSEIYLTGTQGEVIGNIFDAAGLGLRTAIEVHGNNKTVIGNVINNYRQCVITSSDSTSSDIVVEGNTCSNVYRGIYIWATGGTYDGLKVTNNEILINRNGFWTVSQNEAGIQVEPSSTNGLKNVTVTNNHIRFVADTFAVNSQAGGINLSANVSYPLTNVKIDNNSVDNSPCSGILAEPLGNIVGLVIKNNHITNPGQNTNATTCFSTAFKVGIGVILTTAETITGSVIENNTITDNQVTPTMQVGVRYIGVASDGSATGMVLRGDVVRYVGNPPNSNQSFLFASTSMPEVHEIIPNYDRTTSSSFSGGNPPNGSTIYDPIAGRLYTQSNLAGAGTFLSSYESRQTIPVAGKYQAGDWVFNTQPTTNGTCAWVNTVAGSPGTFATVACSGTTTVGSGTVTTAGTAVTNGTCQAQTGITITGATTTDVGIVSLNAALPATWQTGINWATAQITANTCTISLCNGTAGSITPAATALRCTVTR